MKQFLLPIALICFTMFCLIFVHIDNMNKIQKERITMKVQDATINSQSISQ